jgi:hypothetical protein
MMASHAESTLKRIKSSGGQRKDNGHAVDDGRAAELDSPSAPGDRATSATLPGTEPVW